ncbi:MAG: COQ9 family protein [Pseudomonadota bacterium]|nr:COQ9 family protein [Pseudomonadota bacterium]
MTDQDTLLDAIQMHVPFDGWSEAALRAACEDTDTPLDMAHTLFPRGAVDMAFAYHKRGDRQMVEALGAMDLTALKFREKVTAAVRKRLEVADKELVRRGMALFALPQHAADGSKALWGTSSLIWDTLGDTSRDVNWYTKRATLSAVYSSTVLYWLGDDSEGQEATWAFLDRRIENVMQFEKVKGKLRSNALVDAFMKGPGRVLDNIRAPGEHRTGYPGRWSTHR